MSKPSLSSVIAALNHCVAERDCELCVVHEQCFEDGTYLHALARDYLTEMSNRTRDLKQTNTALMIALRNNKNCSSCEHYPSCQEKPNCYTPIRNYGESDES